MEPKLNFSDYNESLKQNKLLGLKCLACGEITVPPKMVCGACGSTDMDIVELSGKGKIETFTTVFVPAEGREVDCPYTIVVVGLEEGPWIMGNLAGVEPEKISMEIIGKTVMMKPEVFEGDKYSAGDGARPLFNIAS